MSNHSLKDEGAGKGEDNSGKPPDATPDNQNEEMKGTTPENQNEEMKGTTPENQNEEIKDPNAPPLIVADDDNVIKCCPPVAGKKPCCVPGPRKPGNAPPADVMEKLKLGYEKLHAEEGKSLLKRCLKRDVFDNLKYKTTTDDSNLLDVVQSGYENLDCNVGVYAPDPEAYTVFDSLFNCIIKEYHGFPPEDKQPPLDWGDPSVFADLDPSGELIESTRVRCGRTIRGYPMNPKMTEEMYEKMENQVSTVLSSMGDVFAGQYLSLSNMSALEKEKLIDDHYLFKSGDKYLKAAKALEFWPKGRGIFMNNDKTFLVWVGEEDHLRIISMQKGGNLGEVYKRLMDGAKKLEKKLHFVRHQRLGYLTFCPTNLGTGIRASVLIKLPRLGENIQKLEELAESYQLQVRGSAGEHTSSPDGLYDISNKRRLGVTEFQAVQEMHNGLQEIIRAEKSG